MIAHLDEEKIEYITDDEIAEADYQWWSGKVRALIKTTGMANIWKSNYAVSNYIKRESYTKKGKKNERADREECRDNDLSVYESAEIEV